MPATPRNVRRTVLVPMPRDWGWLPAHPRKSSRDRVAAAFQGLWKITTHIWHQASLLATLFQHQRMCLFPGVCCTFVSCTASTKCPPSKGAAFPHVARELPRLHSAPGDSPFSSEHHQVRNIREQGIKCVAQSHKTMTMPFFVSRETRAGVGMALRKVGAMAKPDCIISSDGKNLTIKTESTLKTTQFSCNLGEKFEETTADGRKTQTVCTFTNGALVQHQEWDGKESTITRKLEDGKLVVECVMNNVTCTRVYEKVE
uniref:Fatty acid binding protein 5 n=1 Tax=Felis catus TaxID=9685 RepID=A0ABI7W7B0_FELCA